MKRSSYVDRPSMTKTIVKCAPFAAFGGVFLYAMFGNKTDGAIYLDDSECARHETGYLKECTMAYQDAIKQAEETAPRYHDKDDCEDEFRRGQCFYDEDSRQFSPTMTGFFFTTDVDDFKQYRHKGYYSEAMYSYRRGYYSSTGYFYANNRRDTVRLSNSVITDATKSRTKLKNRGGTIGRAMSRGGFGKSVSTSSSRGG